MESKNKDKEGLFVQHLDRDCSRLMAFPESWLSQDGDLQATRKHSCMMRQLPNCGGQKALSGSTASVSSRSLPVRERRGWHAADSLNGLCYGVLLSQIVDEIILLTRGCVESNSRRCIRKMQSARPVARLPLNLQRVEYGSTSETCCGAA
jgi:hypothetical protein